MPVKFGIIALPPGYLPIPPEYSLQQKLHHELEFFGFPLSCHPLELFKDVLARIPHIPAKGLPQHNKKQYAKSVFARERLGEYCQYLYNGEALFRTVGNDSTFYRPPTAQQLTRYLNQIPEDFEMCFKVWEEITLPSYAQQPRYGPRAGQPNPRFLDAQLFKDLVLRPFREAQFEPHTGPFLFEFLRHGLSAETFCERLDAFFGQLPTDFRYAVESRNTGLLCPRYRNTLAKHGVAHVYNHWSSMPSLGEQHRRLEAFTAPFTLMRLLNAEDFLRSRQETG